MQAFEQLLRFFLLPYLPEEQEEDVHYEEQQQFWAEAFLPGLKQAQVKQAVSLRQQPFYVLRVLLRHVLPRREPAHQDLTKPHFHSGLF
jgi:hypothetical protein